MFNPQLCSLIVENRIGEGHSGGCWSVTGATTARSGEERAWSAPPRGTSPTSTSATSRRAESRSRASAKSTQSQGRWGYRLRSGLMSLRTREAIELGGGVLRGCVQLAT